MNPLKSAYYWLFNIDDRKLIYTRLNENPTEKEKLMSKEIASLKAQLGRMIADQRKEIESKKEEESEESIKKELNDQVKIINQNRFGETIDLVKLFSKIGLDQKFRESIEITDKDDQEVFGNLGSFLISKKNGYLIITDSYGNPISYGKNIDHVIFKPETFSNQIKRKRILIPRDKDLNPTIDLENLEVNDVTYDEPTDTFVETEEYKDKVRNLLIKRDKELMEKVGYIKRLELAQVSQRKQLDELKRSIDVYKNLNSSTDSELSTAMNMNLQTISKLGDLQRRITNLTELKALHEQKINTLQNVIDKLLNQFQQTADKDKYTQVKEEVFTDLERMKSILPETTIETVEKPNIEAKVPNPGEVLGQRRNTG